jgi:RNA polymerase sigma-70 factor (ECF subfamily)
MPMNSPRSSRSYPFANWDRAKRETTPLPGAFAGDRAGEIDAKLVQRLKSREQAALSEFYDRWFPIVSALVSRMLKSPTDIEDVVEETFWHAWRQAERYDAERGSVQSWLLTMARSRALDRLRASRRFRDEPIELGAPTDAPSDTNDAMAAMAADPSVAPEHAEQRRLILAALSALPREQRDALELGYFGGLRQSEIAERLRLPAGTVKTRMRLALLKLRHRLSLLREDAR